MALQDISKERPRIRSQQCIVERDVHGQAKEPNDQTDLALWPFHEVIRLIVLSDWGNEMKVMKYIPKRANGPLSTVYITERTGRRAPPPTWSGDLYNSVRVYDVMAISGAN